MTWQLSSGTDEFRAEERAAANGRTTQGRHTVSPLGQLRATAAHFELVLPDRPTVDELVEALEDFRELRRHDGMVARGWLRDDDGNGNVSRGSFLRLVAHAEEDIAVVDAALAGEHGR